MLAWVSQSKGRFIMIFWPKIILLSKLDPKRPKAKTTLLQTAFGISPTFYNERHCGLFRKNFTNGRAGFHRPVMLFFIYFRLINKKIENNRQGNADLYHKIRLVAQDWTKDLPFSGRNLWPPGHHTCDKNARTGSHRYGWFLFHNFSFQWMLTCTCFWVKLEVKLKLFSYRKSRLDTTTRT